MFAAALLDVDHLGLNHTEDEGAVSVSLQPWEYVQETVLCCPSALGC